MVFECRRCGKRFEPKGFESDGTFYTLCEECGEKILQEEKAYTTTKEEKQDLFVFACVVIAFIIIEITGVL